MNSMPWHDIYNLEQMKRGEVYGPPAQAVMAPARPVGLSPDLFGPCERRWAVDKTRPRPKPKTTKNKRRMQKASRKANRKK